MGVAHGIVRGRRRHSGELGVIRQPAESAQVGVEKWLDGYSGAARMSSNSADAGAAGASDREAPRRSYFKTFGFASGRDRMRNGAHADASALQQR
jgi:hypothetical protein